MNVSTTRRRELVLPDRIEITLGEAASPLGIEPYVRTAYVLALLRERARWCREGCHDAAAVELERMARLLEGETI